MIRRLLPLSFLVMLALEPAQQTHAMERPVSRIFQAAQAVLVGDIAWSIASRCNSELAPFLMGYRKSNVSPQLYRQQQIDASFALGLASGLGTWSIILGVKAYQAKPALPRPYLLPIMKIAFGSSLFASQVSSVVPYLNQGNMGDAIAVTAAFLGVLVAVNSGREVFENLKAGR